MKKQSKATWLLGVVFLRFGDATMGDDDVPVVDGVDDTCDVENLPARRFEIKSTGSEKCSETKKKKKRREEEEDDGIEPQVTRWPPPRPPRNHRKGILPPIGPASYCALPGIKRKPIQDRPGVPHMILAERSR